MDTTWSKYVIIPKSGDHFCVSQGPIAFSLRGSPNSVHRSMGLGKAEDAYWDREAIITLGLTLGLPGGVTKLET